MELSNTWIFYSQLDAFFQSFLCIALTHSHVALWNDFISIFFDLVWDRLQISSPFAQGINLQMVWFSFQSQTIQWHLFQVLQERLRKDSIALIQSLPFSATLSLFSCWLWKFLLFGRKLFSTTPVFPKLPNPLILTALIIIIIQMYWWGLVGNAKELWSNSCWFLPYHLNNPCEKKPQWRKKPYTGLMYPGTSGSMIDENNAWPCWPGELLSPAQGKNKCLEITNNDHE